MRFVEHHLDELREDYGVTRFDLVVPTHIHDDHTCGIPFLQRHHGTRCWALEEVAPGAGRPGRLGQHALHLPQADPHRPLAAATASASAGRSTSSRSTSPRGRRSSTRSTPAMIDGRKVAFTGDNYFVAEVVAGGKMEMLPFQTTVLRNSFQLAMHRRCAEVMRKIAPELICPGHRDVLPCFKQDLDTYCDFIARKERAFRELVAEPADHFIDLFWARLLPYVAVASSRARTLTLPAAACGTTWAGRQSTPPGCWRPPGWEADEALCHIASGGGRAGRDRAEGARPSLGRRRPPADDRRDPDRRADAGAGQRGPGYCGDGVVLILNEHEPRSLNNEAYEAYVFSKDLVLIFRTHYTPLRSRA